MDDVVISGGINVPLMAVERALRSVEGVGDVAVVGVDDPEWGARVVAASCRPTRCASTGCVSTSFAMRSPRAGCRAPGRRAS